MPLQIPSVSMPVEGCYDQKLYQRRLDFRHRASLTPTERDGLNEVRVPALPEEGVGGVLGVGEQGQQSGACCGRAAAMGAGMSVVAALHTKPLVFGYLQAKIPDEGRGWFRVRYACPDRCMQIIRAQRISESIKKKEDRERERDR